MPKKIVNVYIEQGDYNYKMLFITLGYTVVSDFDAADLIVFTGGSDVSPHLYGDAAHRTTGNNTIRDAKEERLFDAAQDRGVACVGICRGAQFLNVMNGGKMWQHVTNHAIGSTHEALDLLSGEEVSVTSTHHQMMIPHKSGQVLMTANVAKYKQGFEKEEVGGKKPDIEAVFYPDTKSLCYQPHPEYTSPNHPCQLTYFNYIKTFFNL